MHFASKFRKFVNYTFQVNNLPIYPEIVYIEPFKIINNQCLLSNKDILIFPNKSKMICHSNYNLDIKHNLNIIGNFVQYPSTSCYKLFLHIDDSIYKINSNNF